MKRILSLFVSALCAVGAWAQNSHNGHEYVDLGLPSGTLWATCNVGAENPEDMGEYFMWGEAEPNDYYDYPAYKWNKYSGALRITKYTFDDGQTETWDDLTELEADDDAALYNFGKGWSTPTPAQLSELVENCSWTWTADYKGDGTNIAGYIIASKAEENDNFIFLPAAGHKWTRDLMYSNEGFYMSNALSSEDYAESIILIFNENNVGAPNTYPRYRGYSVRPVYDVPDPIAQIGETIYTDVDEFMDAFDAITSKATVTLLGDITLPEDYSTNNGKTGADINLNLNGHNITCENINNDAIYIFGQAKLTIEGEGIVENVGEGGDAVGCEGTVVINGGTYIGKDAAVYVAKNSGVVMTINGGKFDAPNLYYEGYGMPIVKGGLFSMDPSECVAEGYEAVANDDEETKGDYPYKVVEKSTPTAIDAVNAEKSGKVIKTIENGKVVIIRNGEKHDLAGRKL